MSAPPVPTLQGLSGLWHRSWLRAPGIEDTATLVLWRQGPSAFVDLRIPRDVAARGAVPRLADLSAEALRGLCRCEGFAGETRIEAGVCTWTRRINLAGPETGRDVGALTLTPDGLLETGVEADYTELWHHEDRASHHERRLRRADGQLCILVWSEAAFSLGRAHPDALTGPAFTNRVGGALDAGDRPALLRAFDQEFSAGVLTEGIALITHSTDPSRIGKRPFARRDLDAPNLSLALTAFDGTDAVSLWTDTNLATVPAR